MTTPPIDSVCVYCGARHGDDLAFTHQARALGRGLAGAGLRLVFGAGDVGLMGETARAAIAAGGRTLGVIPRHLLDLEVGASDLSKTVITETMHERKKLMFFNADAVVALPGGAGTLDEMFEVLTWRQIGLHSKPLFVMNVEGYWNPLLALIDHMIARGFADASLRGFITVTSDADETIRLLRAA